LLLSKDPALTGFKYNISFSSVEKRLIKNFLVAANKVLIFGFAGENFSLSEQNSINLKVFC